jgi:hypothetical protein
MAADNPRGAELAQNRAQRMECRLPAGRQVELAPAFGSLLNVA